MSIDKRLGAEEYVILHLRTHIKALFPQLLLLLVLTAALVCYFVFAPADWGQIPLLVAIGAYLLLVGIFVAWPFLKWRTTTYTVTNRRIITRRGMVNRTGHDLPLRRINNVQYERSFTDRLLGCGTLVLETAADEPLTLPDLPRIEKVHVQITEVLFGEDSFLDSEDDIE